jgi:hypothetical protein
MRSKRERIDDINWHDGIFRRITLDSIIENSKQKMNAVLHVEIYPSEEAKKRKKLRVVFLDLKECLVYVDSGALQENLSAGNIGYCHVKHESRSTISTWLHLVDGYVKIVSKGAYWQ